MGNELERENEKENKEDLISKFSDVVLIVESSASTEEKNDKTAIFVSSLRFFEKSFGRNNLSALLTEIGLNDYETEKVITLKEEAKLTDISLDFFKRLDFSPASYKSPLSQNRDWLKTATVDEEKLSKNFGKLVKRVATYHRFKKAEFLAILDKYVESIYENPGKQKMKELLSDFDGSHDAVFALYAELNKFTHRYSIKDDGTLNYVKQNAFTWTSQYLVEFIKGKKKVDYNPDWGITFNSGKTRQTDAVFDYKDGIGLICVTSLNNTENQHQVYKFAKGLSEYSGGKKKVYPFFYCDAPYTANEEKTGKPGHPRTSTDPGISSLSKEKIQMMNIVYAMQVFLQTDIEDLDHFKEILETAQIQIINDDGGICFKGTAKQKVELLESAVLSSLEVINDNKSFWLTPDTIAKDFKKTFILNLCNAYVWLHENRFLTNPQVTEKVKEALSEYTLNSVANISPREKMLITLAKKSAGLTTTKITL